MRACIRSVLILCGGIALAADTGYEISRPGESWQASNPIQDFSTRFQEDGVRLSARTDGNASWEWTISLAGIGRPGNLAVVRAAELRVGERRDRIEYDRGDLVEWYVNDARGLEQGFTLAAPPSPVRGQVALELALGGTLQPIFSPDGQAPDFVDEHGAFVLRYAKLAVFDANGQELPAHMEGFTTPGQRGIRIVFDDRDAVYPVVVDPLLTTAVWTGESDQAIRTPPTSASRWQPRGTSTATGMPTSSSGSSSAMCR